MKWFKRKPKEKQVEYTSKVMTSNDIHYYIRDIENGIKSYKEQMFLPMLKRENLICVNNKNPQDNSYIVIWEYANKEKIIVVIPNKSTCKWMQLFGLSVSNISKITSDCYVSDSWMSMEKKIAFILHSIDEVIESKDY